MNSNIAVGRIKYIDFAKAIGIIAVVFQHVEANSLTVRQVTASFVMPLFFIFSGMVLSANKGFISFVKKRFFGIYLPYLLWAFILSSGISPYNIAYILYGSNRTISKSGALGSLWFLPCMFSASILFGVFLTLYKNVTNRKIYRALLLLTAVVCGAAGIFLSSLQFEKGLPFGFDVSLFALFFMLVGFLSKDFFGKIDSLNLGLKIIVFVVSLSVTVLIALNNVPADSRMAVMAQGKYGNPALFVLSSFAGTISVTAIASVLSAVKDKNPISRLLSYTGKSTLGIFCMHYIFIIIIERFMPTLTFVPQHLIGLIITIVATALSIVFVFCISKTVPELLGMRSATKNESRNK